MPIYMCVEYCSGDSEAHRRRSRAVGWCGVTAVAWGDEGGSPLGSPFKLNPFRDVFKREHWRAIVVVVRN